MAKKDIDWSNLGFGYVKTDKRFVANYKNGAWDNGVITDDDKVVISECAGVLQYSQSCFEGMKAYTTENGHTVIFRPDMNASRMADSCRRLEMPVFPEDKFVEAIAETVRANEDWVPPYGSGASLYIRPYMFGSNPVIGVKPADEYQFRVFTTPVGPYFKGGAKPLTIKVSDFDRAAPHGTGHIKAGLNYAMSCNDCVKAHCIVKGIQMGKIEAVPQRPHSAKSLTSSNNTSLSSTSSPRYSLATCTNERLVIDGKILSDLGVTTLPSLVTKRKLAPPVSSTLVLVAGSRYIFSAYPSA